MEPPPLTVSKRKDPLHDGGVFQWKQQGSPVRSLIQPAPSVGGTGALVATNTLLRSAAEAAAAINRSTEAQQIKRSWEALVGSSPLPAAVRTAFSPALSQRRLAGGALGSDLRSPADSSPFLHDFHSRSSLPAPGTRLQYVLPPASHAEALPPPSVLYRNAVQQQARHRQQQQAAQTGVAGGAGIGGQGVEVETSKFTRVVHSHSPGYQAVVSSTLQVVRQSSQQLQAPPSMPARASGGVVFEEIPHAAELPAPQQQQPNRAQPSASHHEPVVLVQLRLLPAQRAALALPSVEQKQQAASPSAQAQAGSLEAPAGPAEDGPVQPWQAAQQAQLAVVQEHQETLVQEGAASGVAAEEQGEGAVPRPGSPAEYLGQEDGGEQSSLEQVHGSMHQAMAAVGAIVRDLATPSPEPAEEPCTALIGGLALGKGSQLAPEADGNQARDASQQEQEQQEAEPGVGVQAGPGTTAAAGGEAEQDEQDAGDGGKEGLRPPDLPAKAPGSQPGGIPNSSAKRRRSAARAAAAARQQQRPVEQPAEAQAGEPAAGEAAVPLDPAAAPAASAGPQHSGGKPKPAGGKVSKKRPRSSEGIEGAIKRRSMQLRGDAATVQPILRSIGEAPTGIEMTRSGRPRMAPLPFWTNSRLVRNASKDVVGVERKADLLGLSGQPQKGKPVPEVAVKAEGSKAKAAPSAKPTPAKKQQAEKASKGRPGGKEKRAGAAAEQEAAKQGPALKARANKALVAPSASATARNRKQAAATKSESGAEEIAAALQLQQLGQGEAAAKEPASAAPLRGKQRQQEQEQPGPAVADPPVTQQSSGLAALAASAGARAAAEVAAKTAGPPASQRARRASGSFTGPAVVGSGALEGGSGEAELPPLPVVEGVHPAAMLALSQLPAHQRSRCGQCKNCLRPASRQACLARQALRGWDAQRTHGDAEPGRQRQREQQAPESKPQPSTASEGSAGKVSKRTAAQEKRAGEIARGKSPAAKRARTQRTPRRQEQQWQRQEGEGEEHEKGGEREEASAPSQGDDESGAAEAEALQQADVELQQQQEEEEEQEEEADEQGWTASQAAALQRAWLQINPTVTNFWHLVAKQVPGKTAAECYNRHMSRHPTPPHPARKAGPKKYLAAAKEGARMPELKPGASKQTMQNAARKYSRQLQWQQKASRAQAASGSGELAPELLEEMEAAERKDRYIDQILRKRMGRPLGAAPRNRKAAAPLLPLAQPGLPLAGGSGAAGQGAGVRKLKAQDSEHEVRAALASLPQHDPEEDKDSEEGSDYYWSDA